MWHKKIVTACVIGSAAFSGSALAQDLRFQAAVDAMKAQWQSGIPVAGVAALESLRPDQQIRKRVEHSLDQVVVIAPQSLTQSSRAQSNNL